MHLVHRLYRDVLLPVEINRRVETALVPAMRALPGFVSYTLVDFGMRVLGSFTVYEGREEAATVAAAKRTAVRNVLADLIPRPPECRDGRVLRTHRGAGRAGYMTVRTYAGCPDPLELDRRIARLVLPRFTESPGFLGWSLVDHGAGRVSTITLLGTPEDMRVYGGLVAPLVHQHMADLLPEPPEEMSGKVLSESRA